MKLEGSFDRAKSALSGMGRSASILLAVTLVVGCAGLARQDPVQAYVVGVEPLQGEGLELRMLVKLRVQNPNDTPSAFRHSDSYAAPSVF